ncbi:hypothetical protein [Rummeliibacillus pycnus]|uniref:hypothetical protein n=1 Tax=Rummeliibacillus pycnus TaxID=101070 RepID=UPI000C9CC8CC|nr:hypothetical protein [Rummeliibacillus pycnus]
MDIDLELQGKDALCEVILEGDFERIAIWLDGEWSVVGSPLYQTKSREEEPICILHEKDLLGSYEDEDFLEKLMHQIDELMGRVC